MKLNQEYLKNIILKIEGIPSPRPSLSQILEALSLDRLDDEFILHYEVLRDYRFIEGVENTQNIGLISSDDGYDWIDVNIRLTANGHEFSSALKQSEIWKILKEKFKEDSIETLFNVSKELALIFAKGKIEKLLKHTI